MLFYCYESSAITLKTTFSAKRNLKTKRYLISQKCLVKTTLSLSLWGEKSRVTTHKYRSTKGEPEKPLKIYLTVYYIQSVDKAERSKLILLENHPSEDLKKTALANGRKVKSLIFIF